ncbi:MAG: ATP-binding protein [Nitrospirota bacterium]
MEKSKIVEVLAEWNFWRATRDVGILRESYLEKMAKLEKTGQIVTIMGVRRAGKSTLMLQYIKGLIDQGLDPASTLYVNLEDPRWGELSQQFLQAIWEAYLEWLEPKAKPFVFFDEVHLVPGWERVARALHERKEATLFISGSSSKLLSMEFGSVLTGRHVSLVVYPLTFREFLLFKGFELELRLELLLTRERVKISRLLREYLEWGGFPQVVLSGEKREMLTGYFDDVISRDIVERYGIRKPDKLKALARYYLTNIASPISFNRVRRFLGIPLDTVERFSSYLTYPYLIFFTKKFSYSLKEQEVNPRKVYSIDTGLRNTISLRFSEDIGRLYENVVFLHLIQQGKEVFYWKNKAECDFLVRTGRGPSEAIQVCHTLTEETKNRELRGVLEAMENFRLKSGFVITEDYEGQEQYKGKTVIFVPLWKWLYRGID